MRKLLYVEDDEVDILALKRTLRKHDDIYLETVGTFDELQKLDLSEFTAIISDANLPDANYLTLKSYLGHVDQLMFVSGTAIEGESVSIKPINESQVLELLNSFGVKLDYIKSLAENDEDFEREMIDTALNVLPQRLSAILSAKSIIEVKQAAHKAKSSFRVCGMNPTYLNRLEEVSDDKATVDKQAHLIEAIKTQIEEAISFLQQV